LIPAAIGFRAHSGWAAVVAVAGGASEPRILLRSRIGMTDGTIAGAKQPFHAAEELGLPRARTYIARCIERSTALALEGLRGALEEIRKSGHRVVAGALLRASGRPLGTLEDTLASHAKIHTADGEHFRGALAAASRRCRLEVVGIPEREVWERAAKAARIPAVELQAIVAARRKAVGSPWTADEKLATAGALAVLLGSRS
jgi:hypothetical protein